MFVELLESLRCPRPHAESQLVVAAGKVVDRHILDGRLGCPVCGAEFTIVGGIATFEIAARPTPPVPPNTELGVRIAAFLELTDAKGFAILGGSWGAQTDPLQRVAQTPLLLLNPPANFGGEPAGVMLCHEVVPLAVGTARAAALDDSMSTDLVNSAVQSVCDGGRILGPARMAVPAGVNEITRDDQLWVGYRAAPRLVELRKA